MNLQIHLDNRPVVEAVAVAVASNFALVSGESPAPQDVQVLVRHHFFRLDPYMRGRMNRAKSYAVAQAQGLEEHCWVVGLLGCWVVGLLGCWVVGCQFSPACPATIATSPQTACETASKHDLQGVD